MTFACMVVVNSLISSSTALHASLIAVHGYREHIQWTLLMNADAKKYCCNKALAFCKCFNLNAHVHSKCLLLTNFKL